MPLPVLTATGGLTQGMPDTCLVPAPPGPPVPTPFPNIGMPNVAASVTVKVLVMNAPAITIASTLPTSSGDEAGVGGGVVSGMIKGPVGFKTGSSKVKFEGKSPVLLTGLTAHNGSNPNDPVGQVLAPSQVKVICAE
jgi:hypothetical protein